MQILAISGSLRNGSFNTSLLHAAAASLPPGVTLEVYDGLAELPHYNEDLDTDPAHEQVALLRDAVTRADGVLIATPEFNGTIPGALKNAVDWASRPRSGPPLQGKAVAVVGASASPFGAVWAQAEARKSLAIAGADVLDAELPVGNAAAAFDADGQLVNAGLGERLNDMVGALLARARQGALAGGGADAAAASIGIYRAPERA